MSVPSIPDITPPEPGLITKEEVCSRVGLDEVTKLDYYMRKGLPVYIKGRGRARAWFKWDDVCEWWDANVTKDAEESESLQAAKLRKAIADADMAEIELAKERGQVIDVETVCKAVANEYAVIRNRFLSLGNKLSGLVLACTSQAEAQAVIDEEVRTILSELSADQKDWA